MREKYIEERFPRYFIFGEHKDGRVDVTSLHHDTIDTVSKEQAKVLIEDRDKLLDALVLVAQKFDDTDHNAFNSLWYITMLEDTEKLI